MTVVLAIVSLLYLRAALWPRDRHPARKDLRRLAAFECGLLVLWIAVGSPLAHLDHAELTAHMVQPVFFSIAKPVYDRMTPEQKKAVEHAAAAAARVNDEGRLADERSVADALKGRGLAVDTIDLAPFRALADMTYAQSDLAKAWDANLLKRVGDIR